MSLKLSSSTIILTLSSTKNIKICSKKLDLFFKLWLKTRPDPVVFVYTVVDQDYDLQVYPAYVYQGNTAVIRCLIPPFVRKYLRVTSWIASDGARITTDIHKGTLANHLCNCFQLTTETYVTET